MSIQLQRQCHIIKKVCVSLNSRYVDMVMDMTASPFLSTYVQLIERVPDDIPEDVRVDPMAQVSDGNDFSVEVRKSGITFCCALRSIIYSCCIGH